MSDLLIREERGQTVPAAAMFSGCCVSADGTAS